MGKHRHERFREAYAVVRIDQYDVPETPKEIDITVKEGWLSREQAEAEVERLNAVNADKHCRYFSQYTRLERDDDCR